MKPPTELNLLLAEGLNELVKDVGHLNFTMNVRWDMPVKYILH